MKLAGDRRRPPKLGKALSAGLKTFLDSDGNYEKPVTPYINATKTDRGHRVDALEDLCFNET